MINEKATWNSFSGSLCKVSKNRKSISSIRGSRYFGPSKMSFSNLIQHSLSIISVFKFTWLARSLLFLLIYCYFISNFISIITLIPVVVIIVLNGIIFSLAARENLEEYRNSLSNISDIDTIKRIKNNSMYFINPFKALRPTKENASSVAVASTDHFGEDGKKEHLKKSLELLKCF